MEEIFVIIFGLIIGSFLNVVIYRLPLNKSLIKPGSYCASCNTPVKSYDNIPVISFILLGGKCRQCKTRIPIIHPIIEIFTAFSFWLSYIWWYTLGVWLYSVAWFTILLWLSLSLWFTYFIRKKMLLSSPAGRADFLAEPPQKVAKMSALRLSCPLGALTRIRSNRNHSQPRNGCASSP